MSQHNLVIIIHRDEVARRSPKRWRDLTADWQERARHPTLGLLKDAHEQYQPELRRLALPSWLQRGSPISIGERRRSLSVFAVLRQREYVPVYARQRDWSSR